MALDHLHQSSEVEQMRQVLQYLIAQLLGSQSKDEPALQQPELHAMTDDDGVKHLYAAEVLELGSPPLDARAPPCDFHAMDDDDDNDFGDCSSADIDAIYFHDWSMSDGAGCTASKNDAAVMRPSHLLSITVYQTFVGVESMTLPSCTAESDGDDLRHGQASW